MVVILGKALVTNILLFRDVNRVVSICVGPEAGLSGF